MTAHATARCPLCSRRTTLKHGKLTQHASGEETCKGSGHTPFEATVILARALCWKGGPSHG